MSENGKQQHEQSKQLYDRMLRGDATPKEYAEALRREAKAERRSAAHRGTTGRHAAGGTAAA